MSTTVVFLNISLLRISHTDEKTKNCTFVPIKIYISWPEEYYSNFLGSCALLHSTEDPKMEITQVHHAPVCVPLLYFLRLQIQTYCSL